MSTKLSVIIADDHPVYREGIESALKRNKDIGPIAHAGDGTEVIMLLEKQHYDIVFMDYKMPVMTGAEATVMIKERFPHTKVIALSAFDVEDIISEMISAGAHGYMFKTIIPDELTRAIAGVMNGNRYYAPKVLDVMEQRMKFQNALGRASGAKSSLTDAETEILLLRCKGLSNQQIADKRFNSVDTIKTHMKNIHGKTGENTDAGLNKYAWNVGLITSKDFYADIN